MILDAAAAAELTLAATEAGGSVVGLTVVGHPNDEALGRRLLVLRSGTNDTETVHGTLGSVELDEAARAIALDVLEDAAATNGLRLVPVGDRELELYLEVRRAVQELVIVGAGHIARPLSTIGALLGFRVIVVDDRPEFATRERFPEASRLIRADFSDPFHDVPIHRGSYILLVTRGHRYDYECLVRILRADLKPSYIGMIGSRRRVRATFARLLEEGVPRVRLEEIYSPVGLDLGAETPGEIAVAVAAELVKAQRGGTGVSLKDVERVAERFFPEHGEEKGSSR